MWGTIRALSTEDEKLLVNRVKQIATKTAEAHGATAEVEAPYSSHYPVTFNNVALTEKMVPSLEKAAGAENVQLIAPHTGAEDFAFFQEKVPGLFFFIGGCPPDVDPSKAPSHHTPDFMIDERGMVTGVKAFLHLVLDYQNDPGM
jgi:metal-dependent amidase/aminoacylase/carboxypeptidase family protein